jgi:hypothetical protein
MRSNLSFPMECPGGRHSSPQRLPTPAIPGLFLRTRRKGGWPIQGAFNIYIQLDMHVKHEIRGFFRRRGFGCESMKDRDRFFGAKPLPVHDTQFISGAHALKRSFGVRAACCRFSLSQACLRESNLTLPLPSCRHHGALECVQLAAAFPSRKLACESFATPFNLANPLARCFRNYLDLCLR